jgi:hypothetical protein
MKAAVLSSALLLLAAVVHVVTTIVGFLGVADYDGIPFLAFFLLLYLLAVVWINIVPFVMAILDLRRGGYRVALAVFAAVFLLWHVAPLVAVAAKAGDGAIQFYYGIGGNPVVGIVYQVVMTVLVATALGLLVWRGRWNSGTLEFRRRARGYYTPDLPFPEQATYPPLSRD